MYLRNMAVVSLSRETPGEEVVEQDTGQAGEEGFYIVLCSRKLASRRDS